jgi:hypothetical protein
MHNIIFKLINYSISRKSKLTPTAFYGLLVIMIEHCTYPPHHNNMLQAENKPFTSDTRRVIFFDYEMSGLEQKKGIPHNCNIPFKHSFLFINQLIFSQCISSNPAMQSL